MNSMTKIQFCAVSLKVAFVITAVIFGFIGFHYAFERSAPMEFGKSSDVQVVNVEKNVFYLSDNPNLAIPRTSAPTSMIVGFLTMGSVFACTYFVLTFGALWLSARYLPRFHNSFKVIAFSSTLME